MTREVCVHQRSPADRPGFRLAFILSLLLFATGAAQGQQSSVSTWDAVDFRIWGYVPYWSGEAGTSVVGQLQAMSSAGTYNHVSDVIYFGGVRPTSTGGLAYHSTATQSLNTLKSLAAQHGFRLHMSMFDVSGGTVDAVWTSLVSNPTYRANFVSNVTNLLDTYNMQGFNFDWERPNTVEKWGNYTQLARELGNVIRPLGMEVSVCDYGFADSRWDDSPLFDARVYDQLFIMGYHYPAYSGNSLNNNNFANGKLALVGQGAEKAFTDQQLTIGVGTWGTGGPATVTLRSFATANPNLAYDAESVSGTYVDVNGVTRTGTWQIESRKQVREKTQLALDRGMPGMFSWTLHYDARDQLGLHRVMHHYAAVQRGAPDLNLDGKVNAADANILANNMGLALTNTGRTTAAQFDNFYLQGNWERGDRDGNGFVNQSDADWLAGRFAALGVNLPDRLAYSGTFENFSNSRGVTGRWRAWRNASGNLRETSNFTQHGANFLAWSGTGIGAGKFSNRSVTIRNQSAAEAAASTNGLSRMMLADLEQPIELGGKEDVYFTFLVRQNTAGLTPSELASSNRTLSLEFLDAAGTAQFEFTLRGLQQEFAIQSKADASGQSVTSGGFAPDATYLFVGKLSGNGNAPNVMQASLFASGAAVGHFASPEFPWMLTARGGRGYNPILTQLQFRSTLDANYTVSNVWIGSALEFFAPHNLGDFNGDGKVDSLDYLLLRKTFGQTGVNVATDANGDGVVGASDYEIWRAYFGAPMTAGTAANSGETFASVPEPATLSAAMLASIALVAATARRRRCRSS